MSAKNQSRRRPKISLTDVGQKIYQPMLAEKTLENWPKKYPRPKSAKKILGDIVRKIASADVG